jgi:hypothetical protein
LPDQKQLRQRLDERGTARDQRQLALIDDDVVRR